MYTLFPWHWGGGISIFNPTMVKSVKLSNGIFSAKYGRASSGLLEATSIKPDCENFHLNLGIATTSADAFAQIPFGKKVGGMVLGAHLTYLEPVFALYNATGSDALDMIKRPPYVRDFFLKTHFTPKPELAVSVIGFFGSDGMTIDQTETKNLLNTNTKMDYDFYQALPNLENETQEKINNHLFAGRFDTEVQISEQNRIGFGLDECISTSEIKENWNNYVDIGSGDSRLFKKTKWQSDINGNNFLSNAAYVSWNYGKD